MLFQPSGDDLFLRACEADSFRALVAAIIDDPGYEQASPEDRLVNRHRLADDVTLIAALDDRKVEVADHDGLETINVASDEPFIRSLDRPGFVSIGPAAREVSG